MESGSANAQVIAVATHNGSVIKVIFVTLGTQNHDVDIILRWFI